jgi:molybdopterin converting factor small subunit
VKVKVSHLGSFHYYATDGEEELPDDARLSDLLALLSKKNGRRFRDMLFSRRGELQPYVIVLINGVSFHYTGMLDAKLSDGDSLVLLTSIDGG